MKVSNGSLLLILLATAGLAFAQSDEEVVRQTYAKAAYAAYLTTPYDLRPHGDAAVHGKIVTPEEVKQAEANNTIVFVLSDFKSGPVSEILNHDVREWLGNSPRHDQIQLRASEQGFTVLGKSGSQMMARPYWRDWRVLSPDMPAAYPASILMSQMIDSWHETFMRYVSYSVRLQFQGREVSYKALALFGKRTVFLEPYVDDLAPLVGQEVYPSLYFTEGASHFYQPALSDFIKSLRTDNSCPVGHSCCNSTTMECAISPEGVSAYADTIPKTSRVQPPCLGDEATPCLPQCSQETFDVNGALQQVGQFGTGAVGHLTGGHAWDEWVGGHCEYEGTQDITTYGQCLTVASGTADNPPPPQVAYGVYDWGLTLGQPTYWHVFDGSGKGTLMTGYGAVPFQSLDAGEIQNCLGAICTVKITIGYQGLSLSWGASPIFDDRWPSLGLFSGTCPSKWGQGSPIVISKTGKYPVSGKANGVAFDMVGKGFTWQVGWPEQGVGFLALPGPDGQIHSVKQLFGNDGPNANGFEKLAKYDSNHDGVIDSRDEVWPSLRMWYDRNRDGKAQVDELETMEEAGIASIQLRYDSYKLSHRDANGNWFAFSSLATLTGGETVQIWDVFLAD